ncbi:MAG: DNA modification methylase, partial [Fidelibacterota bacterium]
WWGKIRTSRDIAKNKTELEQYRKTLSPGDITLMGLITEGGQGLATANNGKFVGILSGTKLAENITLSRPKKLFQAIQADNIDELNFINNSNDAKAYLASKSEKEIWNIFDDLKEKYGRDIFGQGYLYRIITSEDIADPALLKEKEKKAGISGSRTFVPYDKGDRDGNRWFLKTPYYIDWSVSNVTFLYKYSGKKGKGMPVVRNPKFYFREGFCWTDVNSTYLKSRIKESGVHDVLSMSLFSVFSCISEIYLVLLINSKFISEYVGTFINSTSHFQINDARQLPVVIPSKDELKNVEKIFSKALAIKQKEFSNTIDKDTAKRELDLIQKQVDDFVNELYGVD